MTRWTIHPTNNSMFTIHGEDGRHFANLRFVDDAPPGVAGRRLALIEHAPALAEHVRFLVPRVHRHLADAAAVLDAMQTLADLAKAEDAAAAAPVAPSRAEIIAAMRALLTADHDARTKPESAEAAARFYETRAAARALMARVP